MVKENMKNIKTGVYTYNEKTYNFNFGTDISIAEKQKFVNSVVGLIVDDGDYNFILKDLIFDFYVVEYFTDIDTTELRRSVSFVNDVEQFLEDTNIVEIVKANAFPTLFDELNNGVDKLIEYRTGIHPNPLNDALASLLSALEKKVKEIDLDNMMGMAQKFTEMTGDLNVDSIVKAYVDSDIHKKNLEEIIKSKKNEIKIDESLGEAIRTVVKEDKAENDSENAKK